MCRIKVPEHTCRYGERNPSAPRSKTCRRWRRLLSARSLGPTWRRSKMIRRWPDPKWTSGRRNRLFARHVKNSFWARAPKLCNNHAWVKNKSGSSIWFLVLRNFCLSPYFLWTAADLFLYNVNLQQVARALIAKAVSDRPGDALHVQRCPPISLFARCRRRDHGGRACQTPELLLAVLLAVGPPQRAAKVGPRFLGYALQFKFRIR